MKSKRLSLPARVRELEMVLFFCAVLFVGCTDSTASSGTPAVSSTPAIIQTAAETTADSYKVFVVDELGRPVSGVSVQLCSDTTYKDGITDKEGIVEFKEPAGSYTVHLLKIPDNYRQDNTEYPVPEAYGKVTIVLSIDTAGRSHTDAVQETAETTSISADGF
jgi:hypothetical protein